MPLYRVTGRVKIKRAAMNRRLPKPTPPQANASPSQILPPTRRREMSNREVEAILKNGFPMTLSGTAVVVYFIIAYRYDARPGKKTSYPGMDELMRATTKTRSTVQRALAELTETLVVVGICPHLGCSPSDKFQPGAQPSLATSARGM